MRRRYVAALAVFVPVVIAAGVRYVYPPAWEVLSGYMVIVALMFKHALLSFWAASKLKIIAFFKGLTLLQGAYLLVKRWFLDTVFARWLSRNIIEHLRSGIGEFVAFYRRLNLRKKVRDFFLPTLLGIGSIVALYYGGYLDKLLLFTELKVIVISLSKTALLVAGKIMGVLFDSWLTPILEVFALSWVLTWLEEHLGNEHPIVRAFNATGRALNRLMFALGDLNRRYLDPILNDHVSRKSQQANSALQRYITDKKIAYEYEQFEQLERKILKGHIDAYHRFEGMESITDKRALYTRINAATGDGLDIVAFLSRNDRGELLSENVEDSYYHDVFLLEGFASSQDHGVKNHQDTHPDHTDFWVLNTSAYPLTLASHNGMFAPTLIESHSLVLIKSKHKIDYDHADVYGIFNGRTEAVVSITMEEA
jgi:hypothetical protein